MQDKPNTLYKRSLYARERFDFDIGYLVKSPCKTCCDRPLLPRCASDCDLLDRIQNRLARSIATARSPSPHEPFAVYFESSEKK